MQPWTFFRFCPKCGDRFARGECPSPFRCAACGFVLYFNPAVSAAALVLRRDEHALFIRRAKEPAKGKLAMPGGFIDIGETAESGLRRELREEVNVEVVSLEFLCSHPNFYPYGEVTYPVLDLFFVAHVESADAAQALDDVESFIWVDPALVSLDEIAFPSMRAALEYYRQSQETKK